MRISSINTWGLCRLSVSLPAQPGTPARAHARKCPTKTWPGDCRTWEMVFFGKITPFALNSWEHLKCFLVLMKWSLGKVKFFLKKYIILYHSWLQFQSNSALWINRGTGTKPEIQCFSGLYLKFCMIVDKMNKYIRSKNSLRAKSTPSTLF